MSQNRNDYRILSGEVQSCVLYAPHDTICVECGARISQKSRMLRDSELYEGTIHIRHVCWSCAQLRLTIFPNGWTSGMLLQDLVEHLRYRHGNIPEHVWCKLPPDARDMIKRLRQQHRMQRILDEQ